MNTDRESEGERKSYLLACHECDALHRLDDRLMHREVVHCARCHGMLHRHIRHHAVEHGLALHISALILFMIANAFPFITLKISGHEELDMLVSGPVALFSIGSPDIAVLVLLTSVVFPLLTMVGSIYLLSAAYFGFLAPGAGFVYRMLHRLQPWSMVGVFMLGIIIAVVKLLDLAQLEFGISLVALIAMIPLLVMAELHFDSTLFWRHRVEPYGINDDESLYATARKHRLRQCDTCASLIREHDPDTHMRCPRCGDGLHIRKPNSVHRTWAFLIAGMMMFIPANILPIMTVTQFGQSETSTILAGVIHLIQSGMWPLGMVVFIASIMVPTSKFAAILYLLLSLRRESGWRPEDRTRLYRITEIIGSWSMVDIYVIGLLTSLVNIGSIATILPGIAASFFAGTVVFTMLAAQSFDPRLIWDAREEKLRRRTDQTAMEQAHG